VYEPVGLLPQTAVDAFLPPFDPPVMLDPRKPAVFGSHVDETNALEFRYMLHKASQGALSRVQAVAEEYRQAFGPYHGGLIDAYAAEDAEIILVAMGSAVSTLREAVDVLRSEGQPVGLVKIRCYRPFPAEALRAALGGARAVVVLDRALSMGFQGIVAGDVQAALYPLAQRPAVVAALAGFGGREVTLETARLLVSQARRVLAGEALAPDEAFVGLKPELIGRLEGGAE
jgi:pyruvate ferredoxin oxidoreductase alpha subunit